MDESEKTKDRIISVLTSSESITRNIFNYKFINKILGDKNAFFFNGIRENTNQV